ncbi:HAD family hydrolase [Streptomyces sp. YIM 98790]|uniref:HAD family hydrolase n=1 Tax=Streptomyces sp. YIM 98790 TaxID=2689077 RepID=UPI001FB85E96|nr:HAD family hydrolase [Streptomyces sp. YIM 98790]
MVASDLDRTLVYSPGALMLDMPDSAAPRLLCVELHEGRPLSFVTETAAGLLAELAREALFVPVTTRTRKQYRRIRLPAPEPEYAICANGGHLLVRGRTDHDWHRRIQQTLAESCAPLAEVRERMWRTADPVWVRKERTAEDLFVYLVVERDRFPESWAKEFAGWAEERGWTVSVQGRKVYAVPRPLTKSAAVAEVARRAGAGEILAAGDSHLDADLLLAADHGWRPGHGELALSGWTAPRVTGLTTSGVLCGEEILRAFLHRIRLRRPGPRPAPAPAPPTTMPTPPTTPGGRS